MKKAVIYIHGKGGNAGEAGHYRPLFPEYEVFGFDYKAETPWDAKSEFTAYFETISREYDAVYLIANSVGAYFTMCVPVRRRIEKAFFISPIVDMEKLISDMMIWAGVTEDELREKREIPTAFGEILSWDYICYVRDNKISWDVPTHIVYGEKDHLTSLETVSAFAEKTGATLDMMPGGEHWFHTKEQMNFLDERIKYYC